MKIYYDKYYANIIKNNPRLSQEEFEILFNKYKEGDLEARNKIVNSNLTYVIKIACSYVGINNNDIDDLISEGVIGLIIALEKFDMSVGNTFSTYARYLVIRKIIDYLRANNIIHIPVDLIKMVNDLNKIQKKNFLKTGELLGFTELSKIAEFSETEQKRLRTVYMCKTLSLDYEIEGYNRISETLESKYLERIDVKLDVQIKENILNKYLNLLCNRDKSIIENLFGLNGLEIKTNKELGEIWGCTSANITIIRDKVLISFKKKYRFEKMKKDL